MNQPNYGISEALPLLNADRVAAVKQKVEDFGVPDEIALTDVTVEDLMQDGLLKKKAAEKLVNYWKNGQFAFEFPS